MLLIDANFIKQGQIDLNAAANKNDSDNDLQIKLHFRANGDTLSEKEFTKRRAIIHEIVYPTVKPYVLVSEGADVEDPFNRELAVRERANRVGILQVIFGYTKLHNKYT